jgi:hypothetical protein
MIRTPRGAALYYATILLACALVGLSVWSIAKARAADGTGTGRTGVELAPATPGVPAPHPKAVHFTLSAIVGDVSAQKASHLMEAIATQLALSGRHDPQAKRKVLILMHVTVMHAVPACQRVAGHRRARMMIVTWLLQDAVEWEPGVRQVRTIGSIAQGLCRAPQVDVWAEAARPDIVAKAVVEVLRMVDATGKDEGRDA